MPSLRAWTLWALILVAVVAAIDEGAHYWLEGVPLEGASLTASFAFTALLVAWIVTDNRDGTRRIWPFAETFQLYLFLPVFLPVYLLATRGLRGVAALFGFVALWALGWLLDLAIYALA